MRTFKKRITVVNDGFAKSRTPARDRAKKAVSRYVSKMVKKGWIPTYICSGNAFFVWESIVWMNKPNNTEEFEYLLNLAKDEQWEFTEDEYITLNAMYS